MSEPASLMVLCKISKEALRDFLMADGPGIAGWDDWGALAIGDVGMDVEGAGGGERLRTGDFLCGLRAQAERPADWLCAYNEASEMLVIGQSLFSENWLEIVRALAVLRRLSDFMESEGTSEGVLLVHDWLFGEGQSRAVIRLVPGASEVVWAEAPGLDVHALFESVLGVVRDAVRRGDREPVRDDLDGLLVGL